MERQLDEIENGKVDHIDMLKSFYPGFKEEINKAYQYANTELNQPTIIIAKTIKGQ
jgi:DNA topoisomerase IA